MANYCGTSRTNYFRVTDEEKYKKLFESLSAEDNIQDFTETVDGETYHGFGAYSTIDYYPFIEWADDVEWDDEDGDERDYDASFDDFIMELQDILHPDDAFVYMETGNERLRYVHGISIIATKDEVKCLAINEMTKNCLKELGVKEGSKAYQLEY